MRRKKLFFVSLLLMIVLIGLPNLSAQEATETPLPPASLTSTASPTATASPTVIVTNTTTSPTVTVTNTAPATLTATDSATLTATASETATLIPAELTAEMTAPVIVPEITAEVTGAVLPSPELTAAAVTQATNTPEQATIEYFSFNVNGESSTRQLAVNSSSDSFSSNQELNSGELNNQANINSQSLNVQVLALPANPIFVQDFDTTAPTNPQHVDNAYTLSGFPRFGVASCINGTTPPQGCAQYLQGDPTPSPLYLEFDFPLGSDPLKTYTVDNYFFSFNFARDVAIFFSQRLTTQLLNSSGDILFQNNCTIDVNVDGFLVLTCITDNSYLYDDLSVQDAEGVARMWIRYETISSIPSSNLGYFNLGIDDIEVVTIDPIPPTATPTATPTTAPDSSPPGIIVSLPPIVFSNSFGGDSEIYKASAFTSTQLTDNSFEDKNPAYSPDGLQIAFQSFRNSAWEIYRINSDGTNEILIAGNNALEPDWYPPGSDLVFARGSELYRVNTIGTPVESQLTNHATGEAHNPAISNNGNWIVYVHDGDLYMMDGTCTVSCTSSLLLSGGTHTYPAWSPNSLQLTWSSADDLFIATVDYTGATPQLAGAMPLTGANSLQKDTHPTWSTDGQSIFFESNRNGETSLFEFDLTTSASATTNSSLIIQPQAGSTATLTPASPNLNQIADNISDADSPSSNPTPIPTPTFAPTFVCDATLVTDGVPPPQANIRDQPGGVVIYQATNGTNVQVIGQSLYNGELWYLIQGFNVDQPTQQGWAYFILVNLDLACVTSEIPILNELGQTATPTFTPSPTLSATPSATYNPQFTATPTRAAASNAIPFNNEAHVFGLPPLFNTYPYAGADNEGRLQGYGLNIQGIGATSFAYEWRNVYYEDVSGIHTGLDFGLGNIWINQTVVSMCDGVVIPGRNGAFSGTLKNGRGVSVRCFMDSLASGRADTDGDGNPNLSNIVLVYDHTEQSVLVDLYQVVNVGTPLGITAGTIFNSYDHLHFEIFFARGYYRSSSDYAVLLNPMIMFSDSVVNNLEQSGAYSRYHPFDLRGPGRTDLRPPAERLGIDQGQLDAWSMGGNNADLAGSKATPTGNFWAVQTPTPTGQVEWPGSMYVLNQNDQPFAPNELTTYIFTLYINDPYIAPNCVITAMMAECTEYNSTR